MSGFKLSDYVDVAERIRQFYERFPDGRLCTGMPPALEVIDGKTFIWYNALAYRTPDDLLPGSGWAAEPVPGPTSYTKDSELMNAETAAWGRAIVACGFETKKIASSQEVQARRNNDPVVELKPAPEAPKTWPAIAEGFERLLVDKHWLAEATEQLFPGKPRETLTRGEKATLLQKLQTVYVTILEDPRSVGDMGPDRVVIQEAFANVLDGVVLDGPPDPVVPKPGWLETDPEADRLAEETIAG